jgi:hypothetical protein
MAHGSHEPLSSSEEWRQNRPEHLEEGTQFLQPVFWDGRTHQEDALHSVVMSNTRDTRKRRGIMRAAGVVASGGLLILLAVTYIRASRPLGSGDALAKPSELLWSRYRLEEEETDPEDADSMREAREEISRQQSTSEATRVGAGFRDNVNVGVILGRLTQVAFDTVIELKRAIRGLKGRDANLEISSKVGVGECV